MQCPTCNVVYSNGLDNCPRCKTPAPRVPVSEESENIEFTSNNNEILAKPGIEQMVDKQPETRAQTSTLIEFPGKKRQEMPAWRKDLLEKFKEIQDKRAREAAEEAAAAAAVAAKESSEENPEEIVATPAEEPAKHHLEVVPPAQPAPVNPIVAKALERIERANNKPINTSTTSTTKSKAGRAAVVNGNLPLEQEEKEQKLSLIQPQQKARAAGMNGSSGSSQVVSQRMNGSTSSSATNQSPAPTLQAAAALPREENFISTAQNGATGTISTDVSPITKKQSFNSQISKASSAAGIESVKTETIKGVLKEIPLPASEIPDTLSEPLTQPQVDSLETSFIEDGELTENYDDYAPYMPRMVSVLIDGFVVLFAASPFAAVLELSDVDWTNNKILISLGGILVLIAFFYFMASIAVQGRTWGMATLTLRVVNAETGNTPSFGQSTGRAFLFLLSVAAFFLPFLYALFDAEGRALHDRIAGTIVIKEE